MSWHVRLVIDGISTNQLCKRVCLRVGIMTDAVVVSLKIPWKTMTCPVKSMLCVHLERASRKRFTYFDFTFTALKVDFARQVQSRQVFFITASWWHDTFEFPRVTDMARPKRCHWPSCAPMFDLTLAGGALKRNAEGTLSPTLTRASSFNAKMPPTYGESTGTVVRLHNENLSNTATMQGLFFFILN